MDRETIEEALQKYIGRTITDSLVQEIIITVAKIGWWDCRDCGEPNFETSTCHNCGKDKCYGQ